LVDEFYGRSSADATIHPADVALNSCHSKKSGMSSLKRWVIA
jgi:hypothetical protein